MRTVLIIFTILAVANSRPQFGLDRVFGAVKDAVVPKILRNDFVNDVSRFFFNVDTSDGFHHHAKGAIEPGRNAEEDALEVVGSYSYIGPDGKNYTVEYTAGKNGYEPSGAHLPPSAGVKPLGVVSEGCKASLCGTGFGK